jgi:hypothetical protein
LLAGPLVLAAMGMTPWQMTITARAFDSGCHERTKIFTPFVLSIVSSRVFANVVMIVLLTRIPSREERGRHCTKVNTGPERRLSGTDDELTGQRARTTS